MTKENRLKNVVKVSCEIVKAHLFLKPGQLCIRTESADGQIISAEVRG